MANRESVSRDTANRELKNRESAKLESANRNTLKFEQEIGSPGIGEPGTANRKSAKRGKTGNPVRHHRYVIKNK